MEKELPNTEAPEVVTPADGVDTPEPADAPTGTDPLDALTDVEAIRREAKKYRGIASRKGRTDDIPAPKSDTPYVTRDEFYDTNRNKAIKSIEQYDDTDPLADMKREINENWDDIVPFYVSRNGQDTPENILEDIFDAYALYKRRNGGKSTDDSARMLQSTVVTAPTGGRTEVKKDASQDPRFTKGTPPSKWYGAKD